MFKFKQFSIQQDLCAMKVGTDGVLLGAWAQAIGNNILDIGCGSGVISLMMAQRCANAAITAIDIDEAAYQQSKINFANAAFTNTFNLQNCSLQNLITEHKFDHIISNPPFFVNSQLSGNQSKDLARHTMQLSLADLANYSAQHSTGNAVLSVIYPTLVTQEFIDIAQKAGWFCNRMCAVKPTPNKEAHRYLLEFGKEAHHKLQNSELVIELSRHCYSSAYIELCKDFYLKM